MKKMHALIASGVAAALLGGGAVAWAAGNSAAQPASPSQNRLVAAAPIDTTTESKFTPIAPCRVVDTRLAGGRLNNTSIRDFYLGGTTFFVGQGGKSGGCGIPTTATAVAVTITVVTPTHPGYVRVWRPTDAEPLASFMNYGTTFNASGAGAVGIAANGAMRVRNVGSITHLVIDASGYYLAPMTAEVASNGTLVHGSRALSSSLITSTTSSYQVNFDRDVTQCAYNVSSFFNGYDLTVEPRSGVPNAVYVFTSYDHAATADQFYLTVTC